VVTATIHGIGGLRSTFADLAVSSYQRASVWKGRQKAALIRSLLNGYPTGIIVLNSVPPAHGISASVAALAPALGPSHDIIDGQQRMTSIFEFLEDPLRYCIEWQPRPPKDQTDPEHPVIETVRVRFDDLLRELRPDFPTSARRLERITKIRESTQQELRHRRAGIPPKDKRFAPLVDALETFVQELSQKHVVIQELGNIGTADAERMYYLINRAGTELRWWELLRVDREFSKRSFGAHSPRHLGIVQHIVSRYPVGARLKRNPTEKDSFWDACFALGEYAEYKLSIRNPVGSKELVPAEDRRFGVEGLGFRLLSGFLSHNVSRAAIGRTFDRHSEKDVANAIDILFDTLDLVFDATHSKAMSFALFPKYARFGQSVIPAYPMLGVVLASAKFAAFNEASRNGITLTKNDTLNLRSLTEELFRESLTSTKWAGSGDTKLQEWLDTHFRSARPTSEGGTGSYPGALISADHSYDHKQWEDMLGSLRPTGLSSADRKTAFLLFWVQYLFDSIVPGCLPSANAEFDHIVAFQPSPKSKTTHPLNLVAVSRRLNQEKSKKSFRRWSPSAADEAEYRRCALDGSIVTSGRKGAISTSFLDYANHAGLDKLLRGREEIYQLVLTDVLAEWMSNGD
jgi:hypothetical protein